MTEDRACNRDLVQALQRAIIEGDEAEAITLVTQLTKTKTSVNIDVDDPVPVQARERELSIKIYIEDKDTTAVDFIPWKVKQSTTIQNLKRMVFDNLGFPPETQTWIVGRRIAADQDTMSRCGITASGSSVFLYLESATSVGLDQQTFRDRYYKAENDRVPNDTLPDAHNTDYSSIHPPDTLAGQPVAPPLPPRNSQAAPDIFVFYPDPPDGQGQDEAPNERVEDVYIHPGLPAEKQNGWPCPACTYINELTRPGCLICSTSRPENFQVPEDYQASEEEMLRLEREKEVENMTLQVQREERQANYEELLSAEEHDLVLNTTPFDCLICFDTVDPGLGVLLRGCLHNFCRDCLGGYIAASEEAVIECPYSEGSTVCHVPLQEREIRALVDANVLEKYMRKGMAIAEAQSPNSFHCKTADCPGWCVVEDIVNAFRCVVCGHVNCLTCKAIHENMNCKEYQDDLKRRAHNDKAALDTQTKIQELLTKGDAMNCPQCQVVLMKKSGCDWMICTMCKTEICWATRGPRWGPNGNGDTSGGCRCNVNGKKCHANCQNCH